MKKHISLLLIITILVASLIPFNAFAADGTEDDAYFTQEEFESFEHTYAENINVYVNGLIKDKRIGISKNGNNLLISGYTIGTEDVKKSGFTEVIIQRKKASESKWSDYKSYKDLYSESDQYTLSKSIVVESGYQYRVTAIHYAKKSLLSTQKIEATTGYLTF